jgi:hypothetical protein
LFKSETFPEKNFPSRTQIGVVAHEFEKVVPELVSTDPDGYKGVAYDRIGVYALAAVRELDEEVRTLRAELETIRATAARQAGECR